MRFAEHFHLVIAENDLAILERCIGVFTRAGYIAVGAESAMEAIIMLDDLEAHLLITDSALGGVHDGFDLAHIAYHRCKIPMIIGDNEKPDNRTLPPGAIAIKKPYDEEELLDSVALLLEHSRTIAGVVQRSGKFLHRLPSVPTHASHG